MEIFHSILDVVIEIAVILFEYIGVAVIIWSEIKGVIAYVKKDHLVCLKMARGLATGLEFLLGGEILRTVVVRDKQSVLLVGAIIVMRVALTLLIHWEISLEEKAAKEEKEEK